MKLLLSHTSALEYWRAIGHFPDREAALWHLEAPASTHSLSPMRIPCNQAGSAFAHARLDPLNVGTHSNEVVSMLHEQGLGFINKPIHLLVLNGESGPRGTDIALHSSTLKLPGHSVICLSDSISVVTPELCFVQMATILPFPKLVELGYELCGSYRLNLDDSAGISKRLPLTNAKKLNAYTENAQGANGSLAAKRASRYLSDGSASPMETIVTLLLCLPTRIGGYGFPLPVLNQQRIMGDLARLPTVKDFYRCDLFWPKANVAIEFDSKRYHTGNAKQALDAQRANALRTKKNHRVIRHPIPSI